VPGSNTGDEHLFYVQDAKFNVTALVEDHGGKVVERYRYTPYGAVTVLHGVIDSGGTDTSEEEWKPRPADGSFANALLYCGYYSDSETGLYHVRRRMYHPTLMRWLSRDPLGYADGPNLYGYCGNRPGSATDPWGLAELTDSELKKARSLKRSRVSWFQCIRKMPASIGRRMAYTPPADGPGPRPAHAMAAWLDSCGHSTITKLKVQGVGHDTPAWVAADQMVGAESYSFLLREADVGRWMRISKKSGPNWEAHLGSVIAVQVREASSDQGSDLLMVLTGEVLLKTYKVRSGLGLTGWRLLWYAWYDREQSHRKDEGTGYIWKLANVLGARHLVQRQDAAGAAGCRGGHAASGCNCTSTGAAGPIQSGREVPSDYASTPTYDGLLCQQPGFSHAKPNGFPRRPDV
jgi:RHS repeat-associated protein